MFIRLLIAFALAFASSLGHAEAPYAFDQTPGKLPKDVVPTAYTLHLVPDLDTLSFSGTAAISVQVKRPTAKLVLNALELQIDSATLAGPSIGRLALAPQLDAAQQTLSFELPRPLAPGRYELRVAYRGKLQREPTGFYYDSYPSPSGEKRLVGTQFEPTDARRMFPGWDEPAFRAVFTLSADLPREFRAFSNTPIRSERRLPDGRKRVQFAPTPRMSSYLVALVAGDLERGVTRQGQVEIGVVTTAGKQHAAAYALEESRRLLAYYDGYFGVRYPLPKLDQIATPGGFPGAMENWGAIVYNEARLLHDPALQPDSARATVLGYLAHEMAHQWFGDLVTMAWWDNLWLNEGFATWMASKASEDLHPEWHAWLAANGQREWAMALDARRTTHPIQQPISDESQAGYAFDEITYGKGASFIRMLEAYLGEAPFRDGIRRYMRRHRYSNTTTADLWAALAEATGKPVAEFASDWTLQPGFPLVEVDARCEAGVRRIVLRQSLFTADTGTGAAAAAGAAGSAPAGGAARLAEGAAAPAARRWPVPVTVTIAGSGTAETRSTLLQGESAATERPGCDGAVLADPEGVGFYRVQYAPALLAALTEAFARLPDGARVKLMSDTAALVRNGRLDLADYARLIARLGGEPRFAVWDGVLDTMREIDLLLAGDASRPAWRTWATARLRPRFDALGWDDGPADTDDDRRLRDSLATTLSALGDADVIAVGRERFHRFLAEPASLPAAQADRVIAIAGRHADAADYAALQNLAARSLTTTERQRYYGALETVLDPALATRSMQLALRTDLPPYVTNGALQRIADAGQGEAAWAFAKAHADELLRTRPTPWLQSQAFSNVASHLARPEAAAEVLAFARERLLPGTLDEAERDADIVRERAAFKARLGGQVGAAVRADR